MIELKWNYQTGEGFLVIDKSFKDAEKIVKLDALVDWMAELQEVYESMVAKDE